MLQGSASVQDFAGGTVIDRTARDRAALLLRRLAAGRITNDDFEADYPRFGSDGAIRAIERRAWLLYSDWPAYRLAGRRALPPAIRGEVARWVVFLHSDGEYRWPADFTCFRAFSWWMNVLTLGWWGRRNASRFAASRLTGEFAVWPFFTRAECSDASNRPRFLVGIQ